MMKRYFVFITMILLFASACKKNVGMSPEPILASLTVIHGGSGFGSLQISTSVTPINFSLLMDSIPPGSAKHYSVPSGIQRLTIVPRSASNKQLLARDFDFLPGGIYNLYVTGRSPAYDTLLVAEKSIPSYRDSTVGIRLVNLSSASKPVNMAVASNIGGYDITGIDYKQQSSFVKYPLRTNPAIATTTFNIYDPANRTVLATYVLPMYDYSANPGPTISTARFHALTLVFTGTSVFAVSNY